MKEFNIAIRHVFKTVDLKILTDGAIAVCPELGIDPDILMQKPLEYFASNDLKEPQSF